MPLPASLFLVPSPFPLYPMPTHHPWLDVDGSLYFMYKCCLPLPLSGELEEKEGQTIGENGHLTFTFFHCFFFPFAAFAHTHIFICATCIFIFETDLEEGTGTWDWFDLPFLPFCTF